MIINQFGYKGKSGTDTRVFLLKEAVSSYVVHKSPVYSAYVDSFKAYDRVNHSLLFEKLRSRRTPFCFIRLLKHWYSTQTMIVR